MASATAGTRPFSSPFGLTANHVPNSAKPAAAAAAWVRVKVITPAPWGANALRMLTVVVR